MPRIHYKVHGAPVAGTVKTDNGYTIDYCEVLNDADHHVYQTNEFARLYEFRSEAGQEVVSNFHMHREDTLYVCIQDGSGPSGTPGTVFNENIVDNVLQPRQQGLTTKGLCFCRMCKTDPLVHRVISGKNEGTLAFAGTEWIKSPPITAPGPLVHPAFVLEQETACFRAYRLTLAPGEDSGALPWEFSGVVHAINGCADVIPCASLGPNGPAFPKDTIKEADFFWFDGPAHVTLKNTGKKVFEIILGEWL